MLKKISAYILVVSIALPLNVQAAEYRRQETMPYKDIYEQNFHSEIVNQLDLSRQARRIFGKPLRSKNINVFDEVPDSAFFVNRHARTALSKDQLTKGYSENNGPDLSGDLTVTGGDTDNLHPSYFVTDARGDQYVLHFDVAEYPELSTASEIIASRFYHALGYNVPQYTIETFEGSKLKVGAGAKLRDDTGFRKPLTQERLDEYLLFAPQTADGSYRVAAHKVLAGEDKGFFSLTGRRKNDPDDIINHRDRREIRALSVFAAWLNNIEVSETNTQSRLVTENGKTFLKHYLINFNSSLGSSGHTAKAPMFGHEYLADFGESAKAFLTLGFWEKPWQKRWREAGEKPNDSTAIGYLDNHYFPGGKYKVQMPYEAFKRVTRADGFWAAKQIAAFNDDEIRAMVSAGKLSSQEDASYIANILIERRRLILDYWFSEVTPLDNFSVKSGKLIFKDFSTNPAGYTVEILNAKGKAQQTLSLTTPELAIDSSWLQGGQAKIQIHSSAKAAPVRVTLSADEVLSIVHAD